jgi:hypothetical protein
MHNSSVSTGWRNVARTTAASLLIAAATGCDGATASAQMKPADAQIAEAVRAAPESMRDGAAVLGYDEAGELVRLRDGTNNLLCLADDPSDERFEVDCYHTSLEPYMARGRELRAEGVTGGDVTRIRWEEIEAGELSMPDSPATLYVLNANSADEAGRARMVIYVPYATGEELGLTTSPQDGRPWLMMPGKPSAHIMISQ